MTTYYATPNNPVNNTKIDNGDVLYVESGGVGRDNDLYAGGTEYVQSNGTTYDTFVDGGTAVYISGGVEYDTTIYGSVEYVEAAGSSVRSYIEDGGNEVVYNTASAVSATVYAGGAKYVSAGGISESTLLNGGYQYLSGATGYDAITQDTFTESGGHEVVNSGGFCQFATAGIGGAENVNLGGVSDATIIDGGYSISRPARVTSPLSIVAAKLFIMAVSRLDPWSTVARNSSPPQEPRTPPSFRPAVSKVLTPAGSPMVL